MSVVVVVVVVVVGRCGRWSLVVGGRWWSLVVVVVGDRWGRGVGDRPRRGRGVGDRCGRCVSLVVACCVTLCC